jgi:hypothetical protein
MDIPISIPTDNLYKFKAIFGLVLQLFGFFALIFVWKYSNDQISLIEREVALVSYDKRQLESETFEMGNNIDELERLIAIGTEASIIQASNNLNTIKLDLNKIKDQNTQNNRKANEIKVSFNVNSLSTEYKVFVLVALIIIFWGIRTSRQGFCDWYDKLQRYQDEIIRNQAEESRKKVKTK